MRQRQRRDSARDWIRSGAKITVGSYAKRYGVDRYTAFEDLAALGYGLPESAHRWAQRPLAAPRQRARRPETVPLDDDSWIMLDGRPFFVAGYTWRTLRDLRRRNAGVRRSITKRVCSEPRDGQRGAARRSRLCILGGTLFACPGNVGDESLLPRLYL
jgi:hypothetical protein